MGIDSLNPIISVNNLEKSYLSENGEKVTVFKKLSFQVRPQEFLVILGPTGCGKTTLINLIGKLLEADQGEIEFAPGLDSVKNIPCVFQHYTLFPWRTVLKNISFALEVKHVTRNERIEIAVELIDKVGLKGFEDVYPHELSGGMRQRAALAMALAQKPPLLLLDEPFGALDDTTRADLQLKLINLWQEHKFTVVFITHNIDEALLMADRILILSKRPTAIIEDMDLTQTRPRNTATREFAEMYMKIKNACS